jgi:arylsulfatase A-like enzyme
LDQFAEESFVFTNAYLSSFPTVPNRLDLMSGRFSHIDHEWCPLPPETVTLQQILSTSGTVTQLIADNPHLLEMGYNYQRGFDGFDWIRGQETDLWKTAPEDIELPSNSSKNRSLDFIVKRYLRNTAWWNSEEDHFVAQSVRAACDWLEDNQDQDQFFLHIEAFDPHEPWDAPKKYRDLYDTGYQGEDIIYPHYNYWREFLTEEELDHIHALYMAEVSLVDHWFGVLLNKVEDLGMTEDTAVMFYSDHGYLFGEHDFTGKSMMTVHDENFTYESIPMYDEIRRVPLLIRLPGESEGGRINALVQTPDLMPTIMEMAGLVSTDSIGGQTRTQALQCGMFFVEGWEFDPEAIHAVSLVPLIQGAKTNVRDIAVSSNTLIHHTPVMAKCAIVTEDGWCLHYSGVYDRVAQGGLMYTNELTPVDKTTIATEPALYDLNSDPGEEHNIIGDNMPLAREIHERYVSWLEEVGTPQEHLAGRRSLL